MTAIDTVQIEQLAQEWLRIDQVFRVFLPAIKPARTANEHHTLADIPRSE
jgi:hypothetical protein